MTGHQLTIEARAGKGTGRRILQVKGPLTSFTSDTFKEQVLVETAPAPVVILDMSGVEDVDSNGIGTLTLVHMSFQRQSRRLAVVGLTPKVRRMLEVTRVLSALPVYVTEQEAEDELASDVGDPGPAK
jgi:anti-sigma B factor antagonist